MRDFTGLNIPVSAHKQIKVYCAKQGLLMGEWVAKTCVEKIQNRNGGFDPTTFGVCEGGQIKNVTLLKKKD